MEGYLLHVGIAHGLCHTFAFIVAGPGSYGIHMAPVILGLRVDFRIYGWEKMRLVIFPLFPVHMHKEQCIFMKQNRTLDSDKHLQMRELSEGSSVFCAPYFKCQWDTVFLSILSVTSVFRKKK
jgi:hypothetical protein